MRKRISILQLVLLVVAAFAANIALNNEALVSAQDVFLSAWATVTPTLDGIISPDEWDDAAKVDFFVEYSDLLPEMFAHQATIYVKNNETHLFLAAIVKLDDYNVNDFVNWNFDNDNDGVIEVGDDGLSMRSDGVSTDRYRTNNIENWWSSDTGDGGTNDIAGALSHTNPSGIGDYTCEYIHPLDSADDTHDFSLTGGDAVGFQFDYNDGGPGMGGGEWPELNYGVIIIASETQTGRILVDEAHNNRGPAPISYFEEAEATLEAYGHQVEYHLDGLITSAVLEGFDVLLIASPFDIYSSSEINAIHSFVNSGHGVLLIGEDVGTWGYQASLNAISTAFGITFEANKVYDPTNYEGDTDWPLIHVLDPVHLITADVTSFQTFEGCSLSIGDDVLPLAWGDKDAYTEPSSTTPFVLLATSYYGLGRVVGLTDANAFDNYDRDMDGTINLEDEDNELLLLNMINWLIVPSDNLSVEKVVPIQVIWENQYPEGEAEALIKDKKTVLYIAVSSTFPSRVWTEVSITYNFGSLFIERGPLNTGVPLETGLNEFYLPGGPRQYPFYARWVSPGQTPWLNWTDVGLDNIRVTVDPFHEVPELNKLDNTGETVKKVTDSREFKVLFLPVYFPDLGEASFIPNPNWIQRSNDFIIATYPIAENDYVHEVTAATSFDDPQIPDIRMEWVYPNVALPLSVGAALFGWDKTVIIFQNLGQFRLGLNGIALGMLRTPENPIPIVVQHMGDDDLIAHELGHTLYLWHPHDIGTPVYDAQHFSVAERDYEDDARTFMSYDWILPPSVPVNPTWIDKYRYDSDPKTWLTIPDYPGTWQWNLYDQFTADPDPEVILISGFVAKNGSVRAPDPWYYQRNGTPTLEPGSDGDYYIALLDNMDGTLARMGFNVTFTYLIDDMGNLTFYETNETNFLFTIPYYEGTAEVQIQNSTGSVLYSRSVSSNAPEVVVTYPNGGETLSIGDNYNITWQASDLDGAPLTYLVAYSPDTGGTWIPLATGINETEYNWDTSTITAGDEYLIKVIATDGFNTGEDESNSTFTTLDLIPPTITNVTQTPPANSVQPDQNVTVNADVHDVNSGVKQATLSYRHGVDNETWSEWMNVTTHPETAITFTGTIPELPLNTHVQYRIFAEDASNNSIINPEAGQYYVYMVIPEFPLTQALQVFAMTSLSVVIISWKRKQWKRKTEDKT